MRNIKMRDMFNCIPEIDFEAGYQYFLGNMSNYRRALLAILKSIKSKLPLLHSMLLTHEYEGLRTITQTLRKMLNNVGAISLAEFSYEMEVSLFNDEEMVLQEKLEQYLEQLIIFSDHLTTLLKEMDLQEPLQTEKETISFRNYDFTKTKESIKRSSRLLERKII
ncbi:MAG: hypothetical protein GX306_12800 [Clostridiales bacterium]|jgi:HPt (histidine-containing phosphotransfer) domain-containing protein|nr:hypothetical protein [Clostridiales bacterium]